MILPWYVWAIALFFCWPTIAFSDPIASAEANGAKVTLYDEPCRIVEVSNLPNRATWEEKGKVYEGCFGAQGGLVVGYFRDDKTVVAIPARVFARITGI